SAERLLFGFILLAFPLNIRNPRKEIRTGTVSRGNVPETTNQIVFALRLPNLHATRERSQRDAEHADTGADLAAAIFRLILTHDAAPCGSAVFVQDPERI